MSTRIADLEIKISNEAKGTTSSLNNLISALGRVEEAKKSLDFSSVTGKSNNGFRQLYKYVQSITKIMKPLATEMEKISKGFGALGIRLKSTPSTMGADKLKEASDSISEKMAGKGTTAVDTSAVGTLVSTADKAMGKIDLLRQKLDMLKQKYNELASDPNKAYQANSVALQIQNVESMIQKLEEGEKATTGFAVGMNNVATALMKTNATAGITNSALGRLVSSFGRLLKLKGLRMIVQEFYRSIGEGIKNLYEYSRAIGSIDSANFKNTMDGYSTSVQTLRNTIGATIGQVITAMLPTIQTLINYLTTAINVINQFFAALQGKMVFTKAKDSFTEWAEDTSSSAGGASESIKELQRTILAFDELNVLNSPDTGGSGGGGGGGASTPDYTDMFEEATISDKIKKIADKVKEVIDFIKENFDTIWAIVSNIGLALLAWKIAGEVASFFSILDKLGFTKNAGKIAFGITLSLVGFAIEATGAFDIGKNGANLRNIIQTALGGALGVLGGVIAFGTGSIIVTIPLAIMVAFSGFKVGEGVANLENDEEFQKWAQWVKNAKEAQTRVDEIIAGLESRTSELLNAISTNMATAQILRDKIFEIVDENGKLRPEFENNEQAIENLKTLIEDFNKLSLSDIQLEYKDLSKEINLTKQEVEDLIDTYKKQAQTEAYLELYKEHYKAIIELQVEAAKREQEWNDAREAQSKWEADNLDRLAELQDRLWSEGLSFILSGDYSEYVELQAKFMELTDAVNSTEDAFKNADKALQDASREANYYWDAYAQSVGDATDTTLNRVGEITHSIGEITNKERILGDVVGDSFGGMNDKIEEASQNMLDWANTTLDWSGIMETAGYDASASLAEVLDGTETNYEAYIKLKDYLDSHPIHYEADEKAYEVLSTQFANLLIEYSNVSESIGEKPFEFVSNHKQVSETLGTIVKEYDKDLAYFDNNWLEFKGDPADVFDKIEHLLTTYGNAKDNILRSPVKFDADSSKAQTAINGFLNKWKGTQLTEKALPVTNSDANSKITATTGKWNNTSFSSKSLTVSTGKATEAMNSVRDYWNSLYFNAKGINVKVNLPQGTQVQWYASGGFPDYGSVFIAGEQGAGAEMVGNINGRTGVASQGEITGIRQSVEATGNAEARLLAEQNALLRQILAKEGNTTVSTASIIEGLNRTNRRTGKPIVTMG